MIASKRFKKKHEMKALHECIETCFQPLSNWTMAGVQCKPSDKNTKDTHPAYLLCRRYLRIRGSLVNEKWKPKHFPMLRCFFKKGQIPQFIKTSSGTSEETKSVINHYNRTAKE